MKYSDNIKEIDKLGADIMGFIFHDESPRFVSQKPDYLPVYSLRAGVFLDKGTDYIIDVGRKFSLDIIQLHGHESPEMCRILKDEGYEIIKAFHADKNNINSITVNYERVCKYFLFDTPCREMGGSGKRFDWEILHSYHGNTPFLLSGGISPDYISELKEFRHDMMTGIDINSRFEISPGIKDSSAISDFIQKIKN